MFGGFAAAGLAQRIDDARPTLIIGAGAGFQNGRLLPFKPLLDAALQIVAFKIPHVLMIDRGLAPFALTPQRDCLSRDLHTEYAAASVPCTWLESNQPSYILYTSGTTRHPKGVQRDVGGYAVALGLRWRCCLRQRPATRCLPPPMSAGWWAIVTACTVRCWLA